MSYASIIKRLPKNLRSTTGLALLASLGAHALLLAIAPVFPSVDSKSVDAKSKPAVGIVELTPSEQNRLPPSATLPPFATQLSELPPLPPASSFQPRTPLPLRHSTQSYNVRTRSNTPSANNPRRNSLRQSQTKTSKVPKSVPSRNPQSVPLGDFQLDSQQVDSQQVTIKPQTTYGVDQNYRLRKLESLDSTLGRLTPSEVDEQQLQAPNQEDSTSEKNPNSQNTNQSESPQQPTDSTTKETSTPTATSQNSNRQASTPTTTSQNSNRQASTPTTTSQNSNRQASTPTATSQNSNRQASTSTTTSQNSNRQARASTPTTSDSRLAGLLAENQRRRTQYAYNSANTSTQDAVKNLESWLANVKKDQNIEDLKPSKLENLTLEYPLKGCVKQKPNLAGIVALVNPEGKLTNVNITQSTGYDTLNTIALNAVKAQSAAKPKAGYDVYQYRVKFNYDPKSCLAVSAPASG